MSDYEFYGRVGSGVCVYRCVHCHQQAKWPTGKIIHAEKCPASDEDRQG